MGEPSKGRAAVKFLFWTAAAIGMILIVVRAHTSGQMAAWFYYSAADDGYAVNADSFVNATKSNPAVLQVGAFGRIEGRQAVPVKKGDRLPLNANGVILAKVLKDGKRATLQGNELTVTVPWEIQQSKGFKFKDTFKHKGIKTYPWGAVWNVLVVAGLGLSLGFMAEGFTDLIGIKFEKIQHFEGH
ncbi:MAG: hypothetical protein AB1714_25870 [Acidobacteriota bacterium]